MSSKEWGLGRGVKSLLQLPEEEREEASAKLAIHQLQPSRSQPRKYFDSNALNELAASIKNQGILQPLLVRLLPGVPQRYEIVAGERRWRAAKLAGMTEVPVIITEYTDKEAMTAALVENLQREDLNPLEEAEAMKRLRDTQEISQEDLAELLGKSRSAVSNSLRLLQLSPEMQEGVCKGDISAGHARALLGIIDMDLRNSLFHAVVEHQLSVRETEAAAETCKQRGRLPEHLEDVDKAKTERAATKRTVKLQSVKDLQKLLRETSGKKATISGDGKHGHVTIPYASEEELEELIDLMGANKNDVRSH